MQATVSKNMKIGKLKELLEENLNISWNENSLRFGNTCLDKPEMTLGDYGVFPEALLRVTPDVCL